MKFLIVSHVIHSAKNNKYFGYDPYVREMNIWLKYVNEVEIVAPLSKNEPQTLESAYSKNELHFNEIPNISLTGLKNKLNTLIAVPKIIVTLFKVMKKANHIHLRCPGNIGLLGCIVQIAFPSKTKTAKYAGNWDPNSKQPWSYRLQKWILNNTWLTKNMQVLVYGEWPNTSKNIKPFFTATYTNNQRENWQPRSLHSEIKFMFVGTLSEGKRPLYAIQLIEKLGLKGHKVHLNMYGEGAERIKLEQYCSEKNLMNAITLHGNQSKEKVEKAYKESHFLILPSKSEGWPKVVAEAMFWGCLPLTTNVSCVNYMIGNGTRGKLLSLDQASDVQLITSLMTNESDYFDMCENAINWSQQFTTDYFEEEIKKMILYNESSSVN